MIKYSLLIPYIPERTKYLYSFIDSMKKQYPNREDYELCISLSEYTNPAVAFNSAARMANGDRFILTSPECIHLNDVLGGLDKTDSNEYIVCACKTTHEVKWYQHSKYNNRMLHFCSCISKKNWLKLNGFCEWYKNGVAYEDDDWLERIKKAGIKIVCNDELIVEHLEHGRAYSTPELNEKNRKLYNYIWDAKK